MVMVIGMTRLAIAAGKMEGHLSVRDPGTLYVLDTQAGLLFAEPMVAMSGMFGEPWAMPDEQRLKERRVRLLCGVDDPLTFEDACELIGDTAAGMVLGISGEAEWFDLRSPAGAIRLMNLHPEWAVVKHPDMPIFAAGSPVRGGRSCALVEARP